MITNSECLTIAAILRNNRPGDEYPVADVLWNKIREDLIPFLEIHVTKFDPYIFRMLTEMTNPQASEFTRLAGEE